MSLSIAPAFGWNRVLRLANAACEVLITLDVGPRVLAFSRVGGDSPLQVYEDQAGGMRETTWRNRGGHRLWAAPEDLEVTYALDNAPIEHHPLDDFAARVIAPREPSTGLVKEIDLRLDPEKVELTLTHRIRNEGAPRTLAPWALSVMRTEGLAIIPIPPMGEHPRDLLPNRAMVLWPYTDLSDPRWRVGRRLITLRQDPARGATKIGLAHSLGWLAYAWGKVLFEKRFAHDAAAAYPDMGCNCEIFTNQRMLEVESLGPLARLEPNHATEHVERWRLHDLDEPIATPQSTDDENHLADLLERIVTP